MASAPSKGDPVGSSGMERPGVFPVEVATVLYMRTVTGGSQAVLESSRGAGRVRIYILLDMPLGLAWSATPLGDAGMALRTLSQPRRREERKKTDWYLIFMKQEFLVEST